MLETIQTLIKEVINYLRDYCAPNGIAYIKLRIVKLTTLLELGGLVTGLKKLGVFGASYIYPVFVEIGVYGKQHSTERI